MLLNNTYWYINLLPYFQLDPMTKLRNYIEENNLRLVDFFNQFDQDHSMSVTRDEFKTGVEVKCVLKFY